MEYGVWSTLGIIYAGLHGEHPSIPASWQTGTYLLTVQGLGILHDFIQDAQYNLRGHLALQLCAFQLQVGVEL